MSDEEKDGNTEFVLPIICPHCSKELNLAMMFALMAPEASKPTVVEPETTHEEDEEDEEDEINDDIPPEDNA